MQENIGLIFRSQEWYLPPLESTLTKPAMGVPCSGRDHSLRAGASEVAESRIIKVLHDGSNRHDVITAAKLGKIHHGLDTSAPALCGPIQTIMPLSRWARVRFSTALLGSD